MRPRRTPRPRHLIATVVRGPVEIIVHNEHLARDDIAWVRVTAFVQFGMNPLERAAFPQYGPFPASPCRRAVNQKDREFVVGLFGSAHMADRKSTRLNSHFSAFCSAHRVS